MSKYCMASARAEITTRSVTDGTQAQAIPPFLAEDTRIVFQFGRAPLRGRESRRALARARPPAFSSRSPCPPETSRASFSQGEEFLVGKEGGVAQRLRDAGRLQIRVLGDDLRNGHAVGDEVKDKGDGDTQAPNARPTVHDGRVEGHAVETEDDAHDDDVSTNPSVADTNCMSHRL